MVVVRIFTIFTLASFAAADTQFLEQFFPEIHKIVLSEPRFSRFTEILGADTTQTLPIDVSTNFFAPTNQALETFPDLQALLRTSELHRRHFLATHFVKTSTTLGLERVNWVPKSTWLQTPRLEWILVQSLTPTDQNGRIYSLDQPILPYWFDYANVTTSIQQYNRQTSSLLIAERLADDVASDHTFLAPVDASFPEATMRLLEVFPELRQYLSGRLTIDGILDYNSPTLGEVASVSGSIIRVERAEYGLSFDQVSMATDYILVQRGLVYLIDKLPSSIISMAFLEAQFNLFPNHRTYFVPSHDGLEGSAFSTYVQNTTAYATHINRFVGYHTTAIPSSWITSTVVRLPMADGGNLDILPFGEILYIRSASGFPSRTVARISTSLLVLNRYLTPEWMRREDILQYVQSVAPHFSFCASAMASLMLPHMTVFVPTSLANAKSLIDMDIDAICENHLVPYAVSVESDELDRVLATRSSGRAKILSYLLTKLGVLYQVDRLLLPAPYETSLNPINSPIRLFDHPMG